MNGIAGAVLAAILGFIALPLVLRFAWKKQWLDIPDERKLHDAPTPRVAGLVFFPVILAVVLILSTREEINSFPRPIIGLLFGCSFVYMIEFIDDLRSVSWKSKFIMQGVAAMLLILCGVWLRDLGGILGIHEIPPIVGTPFFSTPNGSMLGSRSVSKYFLRRMYLMKYSPNHAEMMSDRMSAVSERKEM